MNMHRKRHPGSILLIALVLGALFGACGAEQPTGSTVNTVPGFVTAGTPTAGLNTCMSCHPVTTEAWESTRHANLNSSPSSTTASCAVCHNQLGDRTQLTPNRNVVGCESCHGPGSLHVAQGGIGPIGYTALTSSVLGTVPVSAQFSTCTFCHELLDSAGTPSVGPKSPGFHKTGSTYNILDTHFASEGTYTADGGNQANTPLGYALEYDSATVCTGCHNPHGTADINRDWANSLHARRTQDPAVIYAWTKFNWSCATTTVGCGDPATTNIRSLPRIHCQRCHTTSGFKAYVKANVDGDRARVEELWEGAEGTTAGFAYSPTWKPEMLKCDGCHMDNRGTMRNPGAYNAPYGYRTGTPFSAQTGTPVIQAWSSFQYPDVSSSNVCIPCHGGRNRGETIKLLNTPQSGTTTTVDFGNVPSSTPHELTAAGTLFRSLGYEFEGRDYSDPPSYAHNKIGSSAVPGTGTGGPCVGCHMYRSGAASNHTFRVSATFTSPSGTTTTVSSEVCFRCHAGSSQSLGEIVESESLAFTDAVSSSGALATVQAFRRPAITSTNWKSAPTETYTGLPNAKNNMGASFNRSFLNDDPGAFVHNSKYTKKLIYDSIDWLDDNNLNYSTGTTLTSICSVATPSAWCDRALPYVLPSGVANGASAERPY